MQYLAKQGLLLTNSYAGRHSYIIHAHVAGH